jgi:hypothetical protein
MIIKVPSSEKDIVAEMCLKMRFKYRFFTNEINPLLSQCEIDFMSAECAYHFGRSVQLRIEMEEDKERIKKFKKFEIRL